MMRLLEDLCDIGEKAAWEAIQALYSYYTIGSFPADICGEAKLLVIGVIERTRRGGGKMASEKQSFVMYNEWRDLIQELSIEQRGILLTAVFDLVNDEQIPEMDGMTKLCFMVFKAQIDRNAEKWEEIRQKRREAGSKGGAAKKANQANAKIANQNEANVAVNANVNVNANANVNANVIQSTPKAPTGGDVYGERFDKFWTAYPKKVGKGAAEKAFRKIKPSGDLLQRMISAIEDQRRSDQWTRDRGQYIPNPSTWLNQERWNDETTSAQAPIKQDISHDEFFRGMRSRKG